MKSIHKTLGRNLPNGDYIEVETELRISKGNLTDSFATSGMLWEKHGHISGRARKRLGKDCDAAGQITDEIRRAFPKLQPLLDIHLAAPNGLPTHAKENGWYFYSGKAPAYERKMLAEGKDFGYSRMLETPDHTRAARALQIDPETLPYGMSHGQFNEFVDSLADFYAQRALSAIALLESLEDMEGVEKVR